MSRIVLIFAVLQCFLFCSDQAKAFHQNQQRRVTGPHKFYSYNYPNYGFGFRSGNNKDSYIVEAPSDFMVVSPGLTGLADTVSFQSKGQLYNCFLRHQGYLLKLMPNDRSDLFRKDATFIPRPNLFYKGYTVYESVNYPRHYIRHQGYRLKISRYDRSSLMKMDSSFITETDGGSRLKSIPTLFQSYNYPHYDFGIRHTTEAWIVSSNASRFRVISPGLAGIPFSVSFQSEYNPNGYLRHAGYLLWQHNFENKDLYKNDATFMPRRDLFYKGYTVFESVNYPGHYIRHQSYRLKISRYDGTSLMRKDSSFIDKPGLNLFNV